MNFYGYMRNSHYKDYLQQLLETPSVLIELTSICNFHCAYCKSATSKRKKGVMDDTFFYALVDHIKKVFPKSSIGLHTDGEPTLHPRFYDFVSYLNEMKIPTACLSNGSTFDQRFLDLKLTFCVTISTNKEEFSLRSRMNFDAYLSRIKKYLTDWATTGAAQVMNLRLPVVDDDYRNGSYEKKISLLKELLDIGLKDFSVDPSNDCVASGVNSRGYALIVNKLPIVSGGIFTQMPGNKQRDTTEINNIGFCDRPWKMLNILWNGDVGFCCSDLEGRTVFHNKLDLRTDNLRDIWLNNRTVTKIRSEFINGCVVPSVCQECLTIYPTKEFYSRHPVPFCPNVEISSCERVTFENDSKGSEMIIAGFSQNASQGIRWTNAKNSVLGFRLSHDLKHSDILLDLEFIPFAPEALGKEQKMEILFNGSHITTLALSGSKIVKLQNIPIKRDIIKQVNVLGFRFSERKSPKELGISNDSRRLGVGLRELVLRIPIKTTPEAART